jgi:hypothetical protein
MVVIDTAELDSLRLSNSKAIQLKRGDWLHQLLMVHYDGQDWRDRHAELTVKFMNLFEEEREDYGDLPAECSRIFRSYLQHYKDQDQGLRIVDSEIDETIELPNGDTFQFIIDLMVEEADGGIWIWDHKTVKSFMPADFMLIDAQLARYFWAAQKKFGITVRGVLFNELITLPPTTPELLKNGRLTERQNLKCDVYTYYRTIKEHGQDPKTYAKTLRRLQAQANRWFRRTRLPRDPALTRRLMHEMMMSSREMKEAIAFDHFPRTPDKSCTWGCDYLEPCTLQLAGGDISDVVRLRYTTEKKEKD